MLTAGLCISYGTGTPVKQPGTGWSVIGRGSKRHSEIYKGYDYLPRYAASCVNTREYEQRFHDLFEDKQDQLLLKRNIQLGFEEIATRLNWLERDLKSVQEFFSSSNA